MQPIKKLLKKITGIDPQTDVKPLNNLIFIGSKYHGYSVPGNFINKDSVCYCIGAGEDISFDTELKILYDAKVFIFDPTPEGINYFAKLREYAAKGEALSIEGNNSFTYRINKKQLDEIKFVERGVWSHEAVLKFYDPGMEDYASHSVYLFKDSKNYIEAPVDRLSSFVKEFNHHTIDLVKMEIEGAEYAVLETIVQDKLDVKMILVEFDEIFHSKGYGYLFRIKKASDLLKKAGYMLVHSTDLYKRTFIREDVYTQLKAVESTKK
jgi:FkbM family methyltransferase